MTVLHFTARNSLLTLLNKTVSIATAPSALSSHPFISNPQEDIYLLPGDQDTDHLDSLVSLGVLTSYRYVDASPHPCFLAVRGRS